MTLGRPGGRATAAIHAFLPVMAAAAALVAVDMGAVMMAASGLSGPADGPAPAHARYAAPTLRATLEGANQASAAATAEWPARADTPPVPPRFDPEALSGLRAILLEKANFWEAKDQPEAATRFYQRVLDMAADDPAALAGLARLMLATGHEGAADDLIAQLRHAAPDDPGLASLERRRHQTEEDKAALAEARRLSAAGHQEQAVAAYKKAMRGDAVPDDLAGEYYPALIGSLQPESVEASDALAALGAVAAKSPTNDALQLSYARAMTGLEGSRADGIEKLRSLSKGSTVATEARASWRSALLWQGADFTAQEELETYLRENPSDPELEAKRKDFRESLPSEGVRARMRAYEAMRVKQMGAAEQEFQAALAFDANDVDAMIMIAAIRVQAGRKAEARTLTDRAVALAPERREELLALVGEDPAANARAAAAAAHAIAAQYELVAQLTKQGAYDRAEERMRHLMGTAPTAGNFLQLADIQARAGHLDDAAATLDKALRIEPAKADAVLALAAIQTRQHRTQDAEATYARAEAIYVHANNRAGLAALRHDRAATLKSQAEASTDAAARLALLRTAQAADPADPWLRLELARALQKGGAAAEAQKLMDAVAPPPEHGADPIAPLQAGFTWAQERGDVAQAAAFVDRVPAGDRTAPMTEMKGRAVLANDIRQSTNKADPAGTRTRLLALAGQPDPTGRRGADIAHAILRFGGPDAAERVLRAALAATPTPTAQQRMSYAGTLREAGRREAARAIFEAIDKSQLTADQRPSYVRAANDLAAEEADALTEKGKLAEAQKILTPLLADQPADTRLNLSLGRWQIASGHPDAALSISEAAARRDPGDITARRAAVEAAMAGQEMARARALVSDAMKRFPDDPVLLMQAADISRNGDDFGVALDYLTRARKARAQQLTTAGDP